MRPSGPHPDVVAGAAGHGRLARRWPDRTDCRRPDVGRFAPPCGLGRSGKLGTADAGARRPIARPAIGNAAGLQRSSRLARQSVPVAPAGPGPYERMDPCHARGGCRAGHPRWGARRPHSVPGRVLCSPGTLSRRRRAGDRCLRLHPGHGRGPGRCRCLSCRSLPCHAARPVNANVSLGYCLARAHAPVTFRGAEVGGCRFCLERYATGDDGPPQTAGDRVDARRSAVGTELPPRGQPLAGSSVSRPQGGRQRDGCRAAAGVCERA
ncbi:hypothetical protein [Pseudomonas sp. 34 E 7]|nr:hypothetical protein [Pseudomonas sp. 34 E 7]